MTEQIAWCVVSVHGVVALIVIFALVAVVRWGGIRRALAAVLVVAFCRFAWPVYRWLAKGSEHQCPPQSQEVKGSGRG